MKDKSYPIDFVVPWVDDSELKWREKKEKYTGTKVQEGNSEVRYRDWDTLRYWFRGVEKFAPWVRYIFFITDDQKPEWLNLEHPKLKWVKHSDFIPDEYLPTFNSHVIEWNLHRIKDLSETFVYFNDDVFMIKDTLPEDFFVHGAPCDLPNIGTLYPTDFFSHLLVNNTILLNRHFILKDCINKNRSKWFRQQSFRGILKNLLYGRKELISGIETWHIQTSFRKSTFETLWNQEYDEIHATCQNKLRSRNDITSYCVRNWQLLSGDFYPKKPIGRLYHTASISESNEALEYLRKQKGKIICLNDSENENDFETHKQKILEIFAELLPEKCSFEV